MLVDTMFWMFCWSEVRGREDVAALLSAQKNGAVSFLLDLDI